MTFELWIAFAVASATILAIPGPTVMLVISYALGRGRQTAWATVPGVTLGDFTAMTISLLGAGAILAASATLFTIMKFAGAAYLIWLGIKLWRAEPDLGDTVTNTTGQSQISMFWSSYVVTALNPKSIIFFVAFVPQFVDTSTALLPQFVILEATFLTLAALNIVLWAMLAGNMRKRFSRPETMKRVNRIGGSFLISAGLLTATIRKSA